MLMKNLRLICLLATATSLVALSTAWSHHSHAMFDHSKEVSVTGTVTQWVFRNPHVFLFIDVKDEKGDLVNYSIEMSNIPNMVTRGFGQVTFKPGDKVTAKVHPLKDGRPGGNYVNIVAADGKLYD
jgi:Family of unknown function (DUF6152)